MFSEFDEYINLVKIYDGMSEPYAQSFVAVSGWGATNVRSFLLKKTLDKSLVMVGR